MNLSYFENFIQDYNNIKDIENSELYKTLNITPKSFILLRVIILKYLESTHNEFYVGDIIKSVMLDSSYENIYINHDNLEDLDNDDTLDIDNFEKVIVNELNFIKNIQELVLFGYLKTSESLTDKSYMEILSYTIYIDKDLFSILETGEIKVHLYTNFQKYLNYNEYLSDVFEYITMKFNYKMMEYDISNKSPKFLNLKSSLKNKTNQINKRLKDTTIDIPLEKYFDDNNISERQKDIIKILYFDYIQSENQSEYSLEHNLIKMYYPIKDNKMSINRNNIFDFKEDLLLYEIYFNELTFRQTITYSLSNTLLNIIIYKEEKEDEKRDENLLAFNSALEDIPNFEIIKPDINLNDLVLPKKLKTDIVDVILKQLEPAVIEKLMKWGLKNNNNIESKLLFSGVPGTGKTATAIALGSELNKPIISFDCSSILNKYVGESEKNVKDIFDNYKKIKEQSGISPILLLNEADQFLSSRFENSSNTNEQMHNQMQNIFLEQIERFEGVLIATTNLIQNMDKAFSRRFNHKIVFELPTKKQRIEIWKKKTAKLPLKSKIMFNNTISDYELSGGQIEMIIKNTALKNAVSNKNIFLEEDFIYHIEMELKGDFNKNKKMGFLNKV